MSPYRSPQSSLYCEWCDGTGLGWALPPDETIEPCRWCKGSGIQGVWTLEAARRHCLQHGWGCWDYHARVYRGPFTVFGGVETDYCLDPRHIQGPPVRRPDAQTLAAWFGLVSAVHHGAGMSGRTIQKVDMLLR